MTQPQQQIQIPTFEQIYERLGKGIAQLMVVFGRSNIDGITINSFGKILSQLKWGATGQSQADVEAIVRRVAQEQLDEIKLVTLRSSIVSTSVN